MTMVRKLIQIAGISRTEFTVLPRPLDFNPSSQHPEKALLREAFKVVVSNQTSDFCNSPLKEIAGNP